MYILTTIANNILTVFSLFQMYSLKMSGGQRQPLCPRRPHLKRLSCIDVTACSLFSLLCPLYPYPFFHISTALTSLTHFPVPIKCQLNSSEPICLSLRSSYGGAGLHGVASGTRKACSDDLQGAASPPFPRAAIWMASIKPAAPCWSLRRPKRWDGIHHP